MNYLSNLLEVIEQEKNEIQVDSAIREKAVVCIDRMLDFATKHKIGVQSQKNLLTKGHSFSGIGPA